MFLADLAKNAINAKNDRAQGPYWGAYTGVLRGAVSACLVLVSVSVVFFGRAQLLYDEGFDWSKVR